MKHAVYTMLFFSIFLGKLSAQSSDFDAQKGVAIKGYDPVAYFTEHKAVQGSNRFQYHWGGVSWQFISAENLDSFRLAPEKYAPQYGGYCAYGCSEGHKAVSDPTAWTIVGQKLYLNYNKEVRTIWWTDTLSRIRVADSVWKNQKLK